MLMFNSQALITNVSSKHLKINRLLPGALCLFITHSSYLNAQLSGCQLTAWGHLEEVLTHGYTYRVVWQIPSDTRGEESKLSYKNSFDFLSVCKCAGMKKVIWIKPRLYCCLTARASWVWIYWWFPPAGVCQFAYSSGACVGSLWLPPTIQRHAC